MKIRVKKVCLADADTRKNIRRWHIKIRRVFLRPNLRVLKFPKSMYYGISNLSSCNIYDGKKNRPVGLIKYATNDKEGSIVTFYNERSKNLPVDESIIEDEEKTMNQLLN